MVSLRRWKLYLTVSLLVVLVVALSLAYYASTAPRIDRLPLMTETEALNSIPYPHYYNATYKFSSGTTEWLVALQVNFFSNANPFVAMFLYKIGGDSGTNLAILGLDLQSNVSGWLNIILWNSQLEQNTTTVTAELHAGKPATFSVDMGLQVQVYTSFLYLPIPQEKIRVPITTTFHWPGPSS